MTTGKQTAINKATDPCGTNRFIPIENILEVYLAPNCEVVVYLEDSLTGSVTFRTSKDEF